MTYRIRTLAAICAAFATTSVLLGSAPAHGSEDTRACVSASEFARLPAGLTRRQVETRWEVVGLSTWDADRSNPGHDAYTYPACGEHSAEITVRVTYTRHTRVWTVRVWNRHYS